MKQLLVVVLTLFFLAALACDSEGTNVSGNGDGDDVAEGGGDDTPGGGSEDGGADTEPVDDGPPFDDTLAWKVLNPGEKEMWNAMTGIANEDGSYSVFVAGGFGAVMWYNSQSGKWHHINLAQSEEVKSIWAASEDYIAVAGEDGLLKRYYDYSGAGTLEWYNDDLSSGLNSTLESLHGHDKDNLWAVGEAGGVLQLSGDAWKKWSPAEMGVSDSPPPDFNAVLALGPDKALITGDGLIVEYNAGTFTVNDTEFADYKLRVLHMAPDAIWMGADKGSLFKQLPDGTFEKHVANVYSQFRTLWSSPEGVVYAAGSQNPNIWSYDGNADDSWDFLEVASPKFIEDSYPDHLVDPASRITGIWGTGGQNIYACSKEKQVLHYAVHK